MNEIKIENWNNHSIRFIYKDGEWYAVATDVCEALGLKQVTRALSSLAGVTKSKVRSGGEMREVNIIPEKDIYRLAFKSRKDEAIEFQDWVLDTISLLRKSIGLEGFEIFRMLDKEHQKEAMAKLTHGTGSKEKKTYAKANMITDKAIAIKHGFAKAIKKGEMTPQMLVERQEILEATTDLMVTQAKYGVPEHVSKVIYSKYAGEQI